MSLLSIITISFNNKDELLATLKPLQNANIDELEIIVIASGYSFSDKRELSEYLTNQDIIQIWDSDHSLYNAMNLGIDKASGNYLWFLNSGDLLFKDFSLSVLLNTIKADKKVHGFGALNNFASDYYLRPPKKHFENPYYYCHQSIITPRESGSAETIYYDESGRLDADRHWILDKVNLYGFKSHEEILTIHTLGGISTNPSIKSIKMRLETGGIKQASIELIKFILILLLGKTTYYMLISKLAGFNKIRIT